MTGPQIVSLRQNLLDTRLGACTPSLQRPILPVLYNSHLRRRRSQHLATLVVHASRQDEKSLSQLEREVPPEQRPVNELQELKDSILYSWVSLKTFIFLFSRPVSLSVSIQILSKISLFFHHFLTLAYISFRQPWN